MFVLLESGSHVNIDHIVWTSEAKQDKKGWYITVFLSAPICKDTDGSPAYSFLLYNDDAMKVLKAIERQRARKGEIHI